MITEIVKQSKTIGKRRGPWVQGVSGNPNGRPKCPEREILRKALEKDCKENNKHLIQFAIERSKESDVVLVAILKKILPDMTEAELKGSIENGTKILIVNPPGYKIKDERNRIDSQTVSS